MRDTKKHPRIEPKWWDYLANVATIIASINEDEEEAKKDREKHEAKIRICK